MVGRRVVDGRPLRQGIGGAGLVYGAARVWRTAEGDLMGSGMDDTKGKVKEAAGDLTDNEKLKREGKADQVGARVKELAENAKDKISDAVDDLKDKLHKN